MQKIIIACAVLFLGSSAYGQEGPRPSVRVNVESELVKGAPYAADVLTDSVQTLADGNRIARHTTARVYRDSNGRTRREADRPDGTSEITISDPVAQTAWVLDTGRHTVRQMPVAAMMPLTELRSDLEGKLMMQVMTLLNGQPRVYAIAGSAGDRRDSSIEERLAPRTIEGLRVDGIRRTQTIPAGAAGNERPIVITTEEWTSPDLKVLVLSEHSDPRTGTSTYKLVKVSRVEPAVPLFQVPADYTVVTVGRGERGALGQR